MVDTNYHHVIAWYRASRQLGVGRFSNEELRQAATRGTCSLRGAQPHPARSPATTWISPRE